MTKPKTNESQFHRNKKNSKASLGPHESVVTLLKSPQSRDRKKNWLETLGKFDLRRNARSKELHFLQGRSPVVCWNDWRWIKYSVSSSYGISVFYHQSELPNAKFMSEVKIPCQKKNNKTRNTSLLATAITMEMNLRNLLFKTWTWTMFHLLIF